MNIYEKLLNIQTELKAPKNQYSDFGKYHYRSCEDILEGLKPLLVKYKATIVIEDEIVQIGDRYYIKATAKLLDWSNEGNFDYIQTTAYAREDENKAKMDLSQMTGSASSYARKYALNGLFAIDDTKDSDAQPKQDETPGKPPAQPPAPPKPPTAPKVEMITKTQQNEIFKLAGEKNYTPESMVSYLKNTYNKASSKDLTKAEADELIKIFKGMKGE